MTEIELRKYQHEGVKFLMSRPRGMIADDPGLGKTFQMLLASVGRTLVIAPKMIHDGKTWEKDIAKLDLDPDRFTMAPYTSLCARDGRKVVEKVRPEFEGPWDTILCDEAHYLKGRGTSWTKVLQKVGKKTPRLYLATGTPISNYAPELFTSLQLLYPEEAVGGKTYGSYWRWIESWFRVDLSRFNPNARVIGDLLACVPACQDRPAYDSCDHYREFFQQNLGDRYIQRKRDDVLTDLPPMTEQTIECPMTAKQAREYRSMKKELLAENTNGDMVVAWTKSAAHMKLDQIATGLGVLTGTGEESGKLERLRYDLENRTRPTLVVAHYRATVDASAAVARSLGLSVATIDGGVSKPDREKAVEDFQAGRLDVLVGSLETISEGLTLTAADLVIFVEKSWKPSRNEQALRRIHRIGQDRPCVAYDYVTPGTVDVGKREILASKTDQQIRVLTHGVVRALL